MSIMDVGGNDIKSIFHWAKKMTGSNCLKSQPKTVQALDIQMYVMGNKSYMVINWRFCCNSKCYFGGSSCINWSSSNRLFLAAIYAGLYCSKDYKQSV